MKQILKSTCFIVCWFGFIRGITYYIEPVNLPNCYLDFSKTDYKITSNCNGGVKFVLVKGLSGVQGSISFQSAEDNSLYIRHKSFIAYLHKFTLFNNIPQDGSFYILPSNDNLYIKVQSTNYQKRFLQKKNLDFGIEESLTPDSHFKLLVYDLNITVIEILSQVGYSVKVTFNLISNVSTGYVVNYLNLNNVISSNATNGSAVIDNLQNSNAYSFFVGVRNEFGFYVYGKHFNYQANENYLMIKRIESINRYSVIVTVNSDIPVWNLTTYFVIKCNDPYNTIKDYPVTNYTCEISSLQSFTVYNFTAVVLNELGLFVHGQVFSYRTDEDVPTGCPRNFTVATVNFTTLFLSWDEVEYSKRKGFIIIFVYLCSNTEVTISNTVSNTTLNVTVSNLNPDSYYNCCVSACTKVGCGLKTCVYNNTLVGIPSGPPLNFAVKPVNFSSLLLSWDKVEYSKTNGTVVGYKYLCNNKLNHWYTVDNNTFYAVVTNLIFNTTYNCSITACTKIGCGVQTSMLNTTLDGLPEESAEITYIGYINSSAINISWNDISVLKWGIHDSQLFCLDIENRSQIVKTECINYKIANYNVNINGLDPYTNYTVLVYCKNKAGLGIKENSKKKSVLTDELPPSIPPKNISVISTNTNNILLQWKPPDLNEYHGVLKSYSILVKAVYSESVFKVQSKRNRRNLDMQIYNGSLLLEWSTILSDPDTTYFNIANLFGNMIYIVNVSANTKYQGVFSSGIEVKTKVGVPLVSAVNFRCGKITFYSITVYWDSTPPGYLQGVLTNYNIAYKKVVNDYFKNDSLPQNAASYTVIKTDAFTEYVIVLTASTKVGSGKELQVNCKTDEAVPRTAPTGLNATSFYYPDKTYVSWNHIIQGDWQGKPLGYIIAYKLLNQGDLEITNQSWIMFNLSYVEQSVQLYDLHVYSRYSLKIAGYNRKDTCHIFDPVIEIVYISIPPFASSSISSSYRPVGVMIASTEQSLLLCAGACTSFSKNISFVYKEVKMTSLEFVKFNSTAIKLPVTVPVQVLDSSYSSTLQLPGFVFVSIQNSIHVQLKENEQLVFGNIYIALGTFGIFVLLNCLFGVILFYCQHENSTRQRKSPCFTLSGIFEEIYFSIITITTVGFGDKTPSTFCGRVLLIIWTFIGLALTSICVGNLISALTVDVVSTTIYSYPNDNVIAKLGSPEYLWANKISSIKLLKGKNLSSHADILEALKAGEARYAILDQYTIEAYKDVLKKYDIKIVKALNTDSSYYGASLGGNYSVLQSCMNRLLKNNSAMVDFAMYDLRMDAIKQNNASHLTLADKKVQLFSIQSPIFKTMLYGVAITLVIFLIAGGIYEVFRIKRTKKVHVATDIDKKLAFFQDMKNLSQEYLTEFQTMIERLQIKTDQLLYKHAEQRLKLRNRFSKLYGVNFKYVNVNDLGVSLEQIAEFREEIKRRPKKTCWERFSEYVAKRVSWLRIKFVTLC
ncbi:uncharacterized protein LOC105846263 isoform X2 [Hydra vulgaris]|uniref:uncharacterized protein LOC105846263 isoform X2 n=1 Tax=Hydra vulgaris TaxID=6087 RepID=UPI001F5F2385|nr:uncharacterized protein LOC105846263 isoform X2 [Hydra vulgaris]